MSCLYILEINPLFAASFTNIFSHSVGCLFTFFMVSLVVQKLLILISSHLFIPNSIFSIFHLSLFDSSLPLAPFFLFFFLLPPFISLSLATTIYYIFYSIIPNKFGPIERQIGTKVENYYGRRKILQSYATITVMLIAHLNPILLSTWVLWKLA